MIRPNNVDPSMRIGANSATGRLTGTGSADIQLCAAGPKLIRRIVLYLDDMTGAAGAITGAVLNFIAGDVVAAAKDIKTPGPGVLTWEANELTAFASMPGGNAYPGFAFSVVCTNPADTWGFSYEVIYTARQSSPNVCFDEQVVGLDVANG